MWLAKYTGEPNIYIYIYTGELSVTTANYAGMRIQIGLSNHVVSRGQGNKIV